MFCAQPPAVDPTDRLACIHVRAGSMVSFVFSVFDDHFSFGDLFTFSLTRLLKPTTILSFLLHVCCMWIFAACGAAAF